LRQPSTLAALIAVIALVACHDTTAPLTPSYDPTQFTSGVIYRWPTGTTIAVFADPTAVPAGVDLAAITATGVAAWKAALAGNELAFRTVTSATDADVIVHVSKAPRLVGLAGCAEPPSYNAGVTFVCPGVDSAITLPLSGTAVGHVKVDITINDDAASAANPLAALVAHELGHAIGIGGHSTDPRDVMYGSPSVSVPSARDVATLRWLVRQPMGLRL
jgi:predicted Zn-dependent protease